MTSILWLKHLRSISAKSGAKLGLAVVLCLGLATGVVTSQLSQAEEQTAEPAHKTTRAKRLAMARAASQETPVEHQEMAAHQEPEPPKQPSVWSRAAETYFGVFSRIQDKMDSLERLELENQRLSLENANLRTRLETLQFEKRAENALSLTRELEQKLKHDSGSRLARTLANINYHVPANLLPSQLYTLAVSDFRTRDDEKAAVLLTFLTQLEDDSSYRTPRYYLMTGVAWYRLDNFELADQFFKKTLSEPETPESLSFQAHARLWRALVAERMGKRAQVQASLQDLVDHHPNSVEASWINSRGHAKEASRETASEE